MPKEKVIKILFIDSDEAMLKVMSQYLSWHGYEVDCLNSSLPVIDHLKSKEYDLLISDVLLEPFDGYELAQRIVEIKEDKISSVRILLVSQEQATSQQHIFMKKNGIYFMTKYRTTDKWIERIGIMIQEEASL